MAHCGNGINPIYFMLKYALKVTGVSVCNIGEQLCATDFYREIVSLDKLVIPDKPDTKQWDRASKLAVFASTCTVSLEIGIDIRITQDALPKCEVTHGVQSSIYHRKCCRVSQIKPSYY